MNENQCTGHNFYDRSQLCLKLCWASWLVQHPLDLCIDENSVRLCISGTKTTFCDTERLWFNVLKKEKKKKRKNLQKKAVRRSILRETWLCFSPLWTLSKCPETSLVFHCHLLGPRSTDKHHCQRKAGLYNIGAMLMSDNWEQGST